MRPSPKVLGEDSSELHFLDLDNEREGFIEGLPSELGGPGAPGQPAIKDADFFADFGDVDDESDMVPQQQ